MIRKLDSFSLIPSVPSCWNATGKASLVALTFGLVAAINAAGGDPIAEISPVASTMTKISSVASAVGAVTAFLACLYRYLNTDQHQLFYLVRSTLGSADPYRRIEKLLS